MRNITFGYNTKRHIWPKVSNNAIITVLCIIFAIVGVLLSENEIYGDEWLAESLADGLFGADNRSLAMLCTNYLMMGIVYLLSLTGLRLHWYNLILILLNLISSIMVCKVITTIERGLQRFLICFTFLAVITAHVYFLLQFTIVAAYSISAGCLWMFHSIYLQKPKKYYLFGVGWILLGAAIRFDCIAFSLVFMGTVWLFKEMSLLGHDKTVSCLKKGEYCRSDLYKYFIPFAIALLLVIFAEVTQQHLMERVNPGFKEWNYIRSQVDDYELPDYDEYIGVYQDIGLSRNDYNLLKSWNNFDPDFFTDRVIKEIYNLKITHNKEIFKDTSHFGFMMDALKRMSGSIFLVMGVIICIYAFVYVNAWAGACCIALIIDAWGLHLYFTYTGRLINRIEYSIWIPMLLAMIAAFLVLKSKKGSVKRKSQSKGTVIAVVCLFTVFLRPNPVETSTWALYRGMSIADAYVAHFWDPSTYGRNIYKTMSGETVRHATYDEFGFDYIMENKDTLFLATWNYDWKEFFPVPVRDKLRTLPKGAAENYFTIGQYFTHLYSMKQILQKWQIDNPFKAMVQDNVRVVLKDIEFHDRSYEINTYLQEHYYGDVNFSVEKVINRTVIGRYMQNFEEKELMLAFGKATVNYSSKSLFAGMSQISISDVNVNGFSLSHNEAFIEIHGSDGRTYTCTTMDNGDGQMTALIYDDIIKESENYTVDLICSINNQLYVVDAGSLIR